MTRTGLNKLLAALAGDPERAGELYLHLHGKLIRYFSWHSSDNPETLADEVLDRVARRLEEGQMVERPVSYILGVARRVLLEKKPSNFLQSQPIVDDLAAAPAPAAANAANARMDCLERCLEKLAPESRALLLEYYSAESSARIWTRQRMADRMGIALNALRNRVLRLRRNLETCIDDCCAGRDSAVGGSPNE